MKAKVRLHVPRHMLADGGALVPKFYTRVLTALSDMGAHTEILHRDQARLKRGPVGQHFDLVHNGCVARPQALNFAPAYLGRFWYADPKGIYFESTITGATFRPEAVPVQRAAEFVATLRQIWIAGRTSRHPQPEAVETFGTGHIAIFLQDWSDPVERAKYMDAAAMVDTVLAHRDGREVVIKPHPNNRGEETLLILHRASRLAGVRVTEANIHDILAGAAVTVSISSSVAVEGMLHGVPAVLFGRSDLHHCAATVQRAGDWPLALKTALTTPWPFEAFLLWFLRWQNLDVGQRLIPRLLERMTAQGADWTALGVDLPAKE